MISTWNHIGIVQLRSLLSMGNFGLWVCGVEGAQKLKIVLVPKTRFLEYLEKYQI